jgi:phosphoserine phosphatase
MRWLPYKHVFFDCDSTLTAVEGIEVLASLAGKGWRVSVLTQAAMDGDIDLEDIYDKRLKTVNPTRGQIESLRQVYKRSAVEDAIDVIAILQSHGHIVYIISGGLYEPVVQFGLYLGVPSENIRAVGIEFDALSGTWWQSGDHLPNVSERFVSVDNQPLTIGEGKLQIIKELIGEQKGRSLLIGDGISDLKAAAGVDLFVGYGGVVTRPKVLNEAPVFIHSLSLGPVLALAMGPTALRSIADNQGGGAAARAFRLIDKEAITFKNDKLRDRFKSALTGPHKAVHPRPFGS